MLFQARGQTTSFIIIPSEKIRDDEEKDANLFYGWQSLDGNNLLQLTDVVIVDSYFLAPAYHRDLKAYIENCLFPLFQLLRSKAKIESPNITIFTAENDKTRFIARELYEEMSDHSDFEDLGVRVGFAVRQNASLNIHKRYIFTNYQGMNPGLSIHGFTNTKVLGNNEDDFEIFPYSIRLKKHENDLMQLKKMTNDLKNKKFLEIGDLRNRLLLAMK
ncbi:MAG TPA: hypothetical protein ENN08_03390 [Bacteroidales bacterium]|nr:hypothetical protein [Bacteroidales bacterium]